MKVDAYWDIVVKDRYGRIVRKGRKRADSFLGNFLKLLCVSFGVDQSITNEGGTSQHVSENGRCYLVFNASAGDDSYGIVLSSGSSSVNISDTAVESKIPNGTSSGQLDYKETTVDSDISIDTSVSPVVARFKIYRAFGNESGGDINVSKVYLVGHAMWYYNGNITGNFVVAEDLLDSIYTVPNGGSINVTLTVEVSLG